MHSQGKSKWFQTSSFLDIEGSWCLYSSKGLDSTLNSRYQLQFDYIEDFELSSYAYLSDNDSVNFIVKDEVLGARGKINGKEILIIDSDLDRSLIDEMIIILPTLDKDTSIEYSEEFVYRTNFNQNFQMTYEKVVDNLIHQKTTNLGFTVKHRFNSETDKLEYLDKFQICFNQKIKYDGLVGKTRVQISCYDYLPWITSVRFNIRSKDIPHQKVGIKTPFKINNEGPLYSIDSVDFIDNKFLISEYGTSEKFYFTGESLFSEETVDTDSTTNNLKLVHIWGSWCGPCIKNLPTVIKLQKEFSGVEFIGICEERTKSDGENAAKKAGMSWKNIFSPISKSTLNIMSYPTYILLENNEVLARFTKIDDVEKYLKTKQKNSTANKP